MGSVVGEAVEVVGRSGLRVVAGRWAAGLAVVLAATACTGGSGAGSGSAAQGGSSESGGAGEERVAPASLSVKPATGASGVAPGDPVVVTAAGGMLTGVKVASEDAEVKGRLDTARKTWTSTTRLDFGARYTVSAQATNSAGQATTTKISFTTASARTQVFPAVSPLNGMTVGVGLPIRVYFDAPVADRKAALEHMKVTTSVPTEGAWRWFSDTEVHWRPRNYWKAGTRVALDTDLYGINLGSGVYGGAKADRHIEFTIGRSVVSVADARTHRMKVYVDGKLARTLPVSMGKAVPGQHTKSGPHVVTDKNKVKVMDSTTYGLALDAGGYRTKVDNAVRISNSGEFVHSAPWSVSQQGRANVSHGCINLSPANAAWFFDLAKVGDVVEVVGTPVRLSARDTDIPDWTIPWTRWGE